MSSGRSFESDAVTSILLFKDFDSGLIPSDSDLSESYMKYAHQTRSQSNDMVLPKMQCLHLFRGVWHYHTQREISFIYLLSFRRELCFCTMLHSKYVVFEGMAGVAVHHLFIYSHSLDLYRITKSTCIWN
jgi:hypothetical protein